MGELDNIVNGVQPEKNMKVVDFAYQLLAECYRKIPFEVMDREDDDFGFLFEYKKYLEKIGKKLPYVRKALKSNEKLGRESPQFKELIEILGILKGMNYREIVLRKYGIHL